MLPKKSRPTPQTLLKKVGSLSALARLFGPSFPPTSADLAFIALRTRRALSALSLPDLVELALFLAAHGNLSAEIPAYLRRLDDALLDDVRRRKLGLLLGREFRAVPTDVANKKNLFSFDD